MTLFQGLKPRTRRASQRAVTKWWTAWYSNSRSRGSTGQRAGALTEDCIDRRAQVAHHCNRREGDQDQQQCVLCQVLALLFLPQANQLFFHGFSRWSAAEAITLQRRRC